MSGHSSVDVVVTEEDDTQRGAETTDVHGQNVYAGEPVSRQVVECAGRLETLDENYTKHKFMFNIGSKFDSVDSNMIVGIQG